MSGRTTRSDRARMRVERTTSGASRATGATWSGGLEASAGKSVVVAIKGCMDSRLSQGFFTIAILANAVALGVELDHRPEDAEGKVETWFILDSIFTAIFCIELGLRITSDRANWHRDLWNIFDASLVVLGIVDTWLLFLVFLGQETNSDMRMLTSTRLLRLLRLSRILRVFRILRFLKELLLLTNAVGSAVKATFWSGLLLGLVILGFGLFLARFVGHQCCGEDDAFSDELFREWFGDLRRTLFTLFATATMEGWVDICRLAFGQGTSGIVLVFSLLLFIMVTHLIVMNLVAGFFIENVLDVAATEEEQKKWTIRQSHLEKLKLVFNCDCGADETLSRDELDLVVLVERDASDMRDMSIFEVLLTCMRGPSASSQVGADTTPNRTSKGEVSAELSGTSISSNRSDQVPTSSEGGSRPPLPPNELSRTSISSNRSDQVPTSATKLELAAKYAGVSKVDVEEIFNYLDPNGAGLVPRAEFVEELSWAAELPRGQRMVKLSQSVLKLKGRTQRLVDGLRVLETDAFALAEARAAEVLKMEVPGAGAGLAGLLSSPRGEPAGLAELRQELLQNIRQAEAGLEAKIPDAVGSLRSEAMQKLQLLERRALPPPPPPPPLAPG